jgi:hypothetical protein
MKSKATSLYLFSPFHKEGTMEEQMSSIASAMQDPAVLDFMLGNKRARIDPEIANRIEEEQRRVVAGGYALAPQLYATGEPLWDSGKKNFLAQRKEVEEQPFLHDETERVISFVGSQRRRDKIVTLDNLRFNDFNIEIGEKSYICEEAGMEQLISRICFESGISNGSNYLMSRPAEKRARELNEIISEDLTKKIFRDKLKWNQQMKEKSGRGRRPSFPSVPNVKLRVRDNNSIFAVVSESYASVDLDKIMAIVADCFPNQQGWHATCATNGFRSTFRAICANPIDVDSAAVGEILRAGITISSDDTGRGSIRIKGNIYQAVCKNLTTAPLNQTILKQVHRGEIKNISHSVQNGIVDALESLQEIPELWAQAARDNIMDQITGDGPVKLFGKLVDSRLIDVPGRKEETVQKLVSAYHRDPMPTRLGIINAITRSAHESSWSSPWVAEDLEEQAGQFLHVNVLSQFNWAGI